MEFKSDVLGLALLGSISAFSIWSAANPSVFTISQFTTEKSKENARLGMNIGLGLCGALSAGLYLAYGKKGTLPSILTGATGVGLYALYEYMLSTSHKSNPTKMTMAEQAEYMGGQGQLQQGFPNTTGGISNWSDSHPDWQFQITTYPGEEAQGPIGGRGGGPGGGEGGRPGGPGGRGGSGADEWVRQQMQQLQQQGWAGGGGAGGVSTLGGVTVIGGAGGAPGGGEGGVGSVTGMPQGQWQLQTSGPGYYDDGYYDIRQPDYHPIIGDTSSYP